MTCLNLWPHMSRTSAGSVVCLALVPFSPSLEYQPGPKRLANHRIMRWRYTGTASIHEALCRFRLSPVFTRYLFNPPAIGRWYSSKPSANKGLSCPELTKRQTVITHEVV